MAAATDDDTVPLIRLLVLQRICDRRKDAGAMIKSGIVSVNGSVCQQLGHPIHGNDAVTIDGKDVDTQHSLPSSNSNHVHYILHKPPNCLCTKRSILQGKDGKTHDDPRPTVYQYLPPQHQQHLHSIGRLDYDTTGLLLFTTDGRLTHQLATPDHKIPKIYRCYPRPWRHSAGASSCEDLSDTAIAQLATGIVLPNGRHTVKGTAWNVKNEGSGDRGVVDISVVGGYNHQVKHMMASVGRPVAYLHRYSFAGLELPADLGSGEGRYLTNDEIQWLYAQAELGNNNSKVVGPNDG